MTETNAATYKLMEPYCCQCTIRLANTLLALHVMTSLLLPLPSQLRPIVPLSCQCTDINILTLEVFREKVRSDPTAMSKSTNCNLFNNYNQ